MRAGFVTLLERILRLLHKRREDRGRDTIHALYALEVECIVGTHGRCIEAPKGTQARARRSPRFAFGCKVSLATTNRPAPGGQFAIGARSLPGDPLDGHTLAARIAQTERIAGAPVARAHVDRGHRHHDAGDLRSSKAQRQDGPRGRNVLTGATGDAITLVLASAGQNLRLLRAWLIRPLASLLSHLAITTFPATMPAPQPATRRARSSAASRRRRSAEALAVASGGGVCFTLLCRGADAAGLLHWDAGRTRWMMDRARHAAA